MKKILECNYDGVRIIVEFHEGKTNPYRVCRKWFDTSWRRKQLVKNADFDSCLQYIADYYRAKTDTHKDSPWHYN